MKDLDFLLAAVAYTALISMATALAIILARPSMSFTKIGIFHPFCDAGGGGERVLWVLVSGLLGTPRYAAYSLVIYTRAGVERDKAGLLRRVEDQFGVHFSAADAARIALVPLRTWWLLEAKRYKRLTLIGQSLGSMFVATEALLRARTCVFVETVGFAFTYPVARYFGGCRVVVAYVHYPTISADMIGVVRDGVEAFNNSGTVARSVFGRKAKLVYYKSFAKLYSEVGSCADVIVANSSWTIAHLNEIWKVPEKTSIVYPPCDTLAFEKFDLSHSRENVILSVGQFRSGTQKVTLLFIGGVRNAADKALAEFVRAESERLGISENVQVLENAPFSVLKEWLGRAAVGIHAMRNEHFGIGIVEYMASGLIAIAHNSGGPKMDILSTSKNSHNGFTGYLASTKEEYSAAILAAFSLHAKDQMALRQRARNSVSAKFSTKSFQEGVLRAISKAF
ncbi:asparagine-linked glycosylation protein [Entophlyctis luteolus]|nr:asparagine-linked glycosylation protein [Entophlyctis luteolus]